MMLPAGLGQLGNVLVFRVLYLSVLNLSDLFPGFTQAAGAVGQVVFDEPVQATESVTWHCSIHMVFDMVVHMPVEKLDNWVEVDRAAAEAKVRHVVLKANMLCGVAQIL